MDVHDHLVFRAHILVDLDSIHSGWNIPEVAPTEHQISKTHKHCKYCIAPAGSHVQKPADAADSCLQRLSSGKQ